MPLTENEELWYKNQIKKYDPKGEYIVIDDSTGLITYTSKLKSDEKKIKEKNPEEYVHNRRKIIRKGRLENELLNVSYLGQCH